MLHRSLVAALAMVSLAALLPPTAASVDVPRTLSLQGVLVDAEGDPLPDDVHILTVNFYELAATGTPLHTETVGVATENGLFDTVLGQLVPIPLPFDQQYWIGLTVDFGTEMIPRTPLTPGPYAYMARSVPDSSLTADKVAAGELVRSVNGLADDVTIQGSGGITVSEVGSTLFISGSGGGGGGDSDWFVSGNDMYAIPSGNIGIGTTTPLADLHVRDANTATIILEATDPTASFSQLKFDHPNGDVTLYHQTTTGSDLFIMSSSGDTDIRAGSELRLRGNAGTVFEGEGGVDHALLTTDGELQLLNTLGAVTLVLDGQEGASSTQGGQVVVKNDASVPTIELDGDFGNSNSGNVRVFHSNGSRTIELLGEEASGTGDGTGGQIDVANEFGTTTVEIDGDFDTTDGGNIRLKDVDGNVMVELKAMDGTGQGRVITDVLEIRGGSDLSESFDVRDAAPVLPGTVVRIDPAHPGALVPSDAAYDRRVAGVVSGAGGVRPGMLMGQRGSVAEGDYPIALTGRVYVRCDTAFGPIEPGDLLTTSPTRGHAMRADDSARAPGATLGKAMTALESGRGLVLVLVTLQ